MKNYCLSYLLALMLVLVSLNPAVAQETHYSDNPDALFRSGMRLFDNEKYGAALEIFLQIVEENPSDRSLLVAEAEYFYALSLLKLYNPSGENNLVAFTEKYPENTRVRSAYFILGSHQFDRKRYKAALRNLERVSVIDLERKEIPDYYFKLGYCYFRAGNYDKAKKAFAQAPYQGSEYGALAKYFNAHIAYAQGDYDFALKTFESLKDDPAVKALVPYYLTQIYFLKGDYQKLLEVAPGLLSTASPQKQPEISKLIGEAYFKTGKYDQAIPYLEKYMSSAPYNGSRVDHYQLGYALYQDKRYTEAITHFKEATYTPDSLSQNAYYHLADCFLKTNDKKQALESFYSAYKLEFDPVIAEDALFNYAKLSYELGYNPYNQAIKSFEDYLSKYPKSKRIDEVNSFLVSLFLSTRNYKSALESIEGIKNKDKSLLAAQQRIYYYRGIELFNDGNVNEAVELFDKAIKSNNDATITAGARFWKAEGLYRTGDIDGAIRQLDAFRTASAARNLPFYQQANYNLGYAYFNKKQYNKSLESFSAFLREPGSSNQNVILDAKLRAGDCNYMNRNYQAAIYLYDEIIQSKRLDVDYALYQKAIATRVMGSYEISNQVLLDLISRYPKSPYVDDARFIVGDNYMTYLGQPLRALQTFESIIRDTPKSQYVLKSLLKIGLIHYNTHEYQKALESFEHVAEEYPGTVESRDAIEFVRNIYIELDQVDEFFAWAQKLPNARITNAEADSTTYNAAENNYIKGNCERAIKGFGDYLAKFPNGFFLLEAKFYKADCDLKQGNTADAISGYEYLADRPGNRFSEEAIRQAALLNFNAKNYSKALGYYTKLEANATYKSDILLARTGQMRCHAKLSDANNTIIAARKLIVTDRITPDLETEAHLLIARSAYSQDSIDLAEKEFGIVRMRSSSEPGAEATYFVSEILFNKNKLKEAEKSCFELVDKFSSYDYWVAKSFILLSDIYLKNDNAFQAKHTLQSIIDNYEGEDLVNIAKAKLKNIIDQENKRMLPPQGVTPNIDLEDDDDE